MLLSINLHIIAPITINRLLGTQRRGTNYKTEETNWDRTEEDIRGALFNHLLLRGQVENKRTSK